MRGWLQLPVNGEPEKSAPCDCAARSPSFAPGRKERCSDWRWATRSVRPAEFLTRSEVKSKYGRLCDMVGGGWLALRAGQVTDDTQMALCIARSLTAGDWSPADIAERFARWLKSRPVDVGGTC